MKKKIWILFFFIGLLVSMNQTVQAETIKGSSDWSVTFTSDSRMDSNFKTSEMDELISGMQPGDTAVITINLKNENATATDWYMLNEVLASLEDRSANSGTSGGAYTYKLMFTGPGGTQELFNSDTVGSDSDSDEAGKGLVQATSSLKDYFYLDTLKTGQSGQVNLEVSLEGETQGNDYQNTLADLQMRFAVELNTTGTPLTPGSTTAGRTGTTVKTGDETDLTPYIILAAVSGGILMLFAAYSQMSRQKEKKGGAASNETF